MGEMERGPAESKPNGKKEQTQAAAAPSVGKTPDTYGAAPGAQDAAAGGLLMFGLGYLLNPPNGSYSLTPNGIAGYIAPIIRVPQIVEEEDAYSRLKNSIGIVLGLIFPNDCILKCTFSYLPAGSTRAAARISASLPGKGPYEVAGFPIVQAGQ